MFKSLHGSLRTRLLAGAAIAAVGLSPLSLAASASAEETMTTPPVVIERSYTNVTGVRQEEPDAVEAAPWSDTGDYLQSVPGITISRMGGHGIEPVIRGLQQNQISIRNDGAVTYGACPNRMDPPTTYGSLETTDKVIVTTGYQSVLNGAGAPGGVVELVRERPDTTDEDPFTGRAGAGFDSAASTRSAFVDVAAGTDTVFARATGNWKQAGNYDDGDGTDVRSSYSDYGAGMTLGWTDKNNLELGYDFHRTDDALFAGAGMDSPFSKSDTFRAHFDTDPEDAAIEHFEGDLFGSFVNHRMDNYSLRDRTAGLARSDSKSDTGGLSALADLALGEGLLSVTINGEVNTRDATRYFGNTREAVTASNSYLWPGITSHQAGVGAEYAYDLSDSSTLTIGGRYDWVHVTYGSADKRTDITIGGVNTANGLYQRFYGVSADDATEHNFGGLLKYETSLSDNLEFRAIASRSVRTADATERGLANNMNLNSWVGNPDIKPEKHHQAELGMDWNEGAISLGGSVFANYVNDYIFRDAARSQRGVIVTAAGTDVYTNINALLAGTSLSAAYQVNEAWRISGSLDYLYGQNLSDDIALAQTPPLQSTLTAEWTGWPDLTLGSSLRMAARQTRVDLDTATGSGRDLQKTPGYAVFDLFGGYEVMESVNVGFGVTNVFDIEYTNHLNRSNSVDNEEIQVNEPGRSFYLKTSFRF